MFCSKQLKRRSVWVLQIKFSFFFGENDLVREMNKAFLKRNVEQCKRKRRVQSMPRYALLNLKLLENLLNCFAKHNQISPAVITQRTPMLTPTLDHSLINERSLILATDEMVKFCYVRKSIVFKRDNDQLFH